ncbi:MAG: radical SAM family heme chaperone HemW [Pseudomonadota bacterium]
MAREIAVYVHWPFCQAKCPYCDFNSHVSARIDHDRWARAYGAEIDRYGGEIGDARVVSVFFGGGTPSLMPAKLVDQILGKIQSTWQVANDFEVTLEANPTSVEIARFAGYHAAGVSRISIGIQSLNDVHLRALGRLHSAREARDALATAQSIFDRISGDLIYARQNQSLEDWRVELEHALSLGLDHMSLYQLTIEDGTAFAHRFKAGGLKGLPGEDLAADLYELTQEMCDAAGMPSYEISNHARPGDECRHNLVYWRGGEYLGIGPGAHGRIEADQGWVGTEGVRAPQHWLNAVENSGSGEVPRLPIATPERAVEYVMMSLRLQEGTEFARARAVIDTQRLDALVQDGFAWRRDGRFGATHKGRPVLNAVLAELLI